MSKITETLKRIISLAEQLCEKDPWWYLKQESPVSMDEILKHESDLGIKIPDALKELFTVADQLTIDFCSSVGYLHYYGLNKCSLQGEGESAYIPRQKTIGWINHQCIYVNLNTGELVIEHERYHYEPINDFCTEILEPAEEFLKKQIKLTDRKAALLEKQKDNPFREFYDKLVDYNNKESSKGEYSLPALLYPPLSEDEISAWEKENNVVLPESYKDWVLLSNGTFFNGWNVYSLDDIDLEEMTEEYDGEKYICLASLTGCCDFLLGGVETGKAIELSEEFEVDDGEDSLMFHLENMIEWYEEDLEE